MNDIQACGHEFCESMRREQMARDNTDAKWCDMGHRAPVALTSDDWSTVMVGLSMAARSAQDAGHGAVMRNLWATLAKVESALGLSEDAASSQVCATL